MEEELKKKLLEQSQLLKEEQEKQELLRQLLLKLLEAEARERLARVRLANPELAEKVETLLFYLYQSGQIERKISDLELKKILEKITKKRETRIIRK